MEKFANPFPAAVRGKLPHFLIAFQTPGDIHHLWPRCFIKFLTAIETGFLPEAFDSDNSSVVRALLSALLAALIFHHLTLN